MVTLNKPTAGDTDWATEINDNWTAIENQMVDNGVCDGRLTLTTGTPITTTDVTGAGTLYFTPFRGNRIALYDGSSWNIRTFSEISLSLTLTSGKNYDVFAYDNSGTPALELSAAWTNDTTRADALALQNGVYVKSGTATRRWLGIIRASALNVTEDSLSNRFVVNAYNQVQRQLRVNPGYSSGDSNTSYTTTSSSFTAANGGTGATGAFLDLGEHSYLFVLSGRCDAAASGSRAGIGYDSTSSAASGTMMPGGAGECFSAVYNSVPGAGYHSITLLIASANSGETSTFYADSVKAGSSADPRVTMIAGLILG